MPAYVTFLEFAKLLPKLTGPPPPNYCSRDEKNEEEEKDKKEEVGEGAYILIAGYLRQWVP